MCISFRPFLAARVDSALFPSFSEHTLFWPHSLSSLSGGREKEIRSSVSNQFSEMNELELQRQVEALSNTVQHLRQALEKGDEERDLLLAALDRYTGPGGVPVNDANQPVHHQPAAAKHRDPSAGPSFHRQGSVGAGARAGGHEGGGRRR